MNDWDDIRFFLAVARSGSVSGAAKTLGVNHSTVSRRIQGLENKHGVRLFNRQREGYEMTEAAWAINEQAIAIEVQNQQISRTLFGQDARLEGPVNLTMPHDLFESVLAEDLAHFQQQHPGIQLKLSVTQGLRNLSNREADIAVRFTPEPPDYLVGKKVSAIQHGLYTQNSTQTKNPSGLILWQNEDHNTDWVKQHFPDTPISLRVDDLTSMYAAVKAGFGIARMPCYLPDSLNNKNITRLPIDLPSSTWSVWVLNHVDLRKTARVQHCRKFLLEILEKKKPLFAGKLSK